MDCCGNLVVHDDDCFIWIHGNRMKNPDKGKESEEEEVRSL
jgi:hypothetical protein